VNRETTTLKEVSLKEAQRLIEAAAQVHDVLELSEYRESHLPGAVRRSMLEGLVTFRPNTAVGETASWMDGGSADSLVTRSDGTFLSVQRHGDLDVPRQEEQRTGA